MNVARYDLAEIKSFTEFTSEGFLRCIAIVTRYGVFQYQSMNGEVRSEYRPKDEVFNPASLDSMKMIPITNGHPQERLVTAENAKNLAIGYTGERVDIDGCHVYTNFVVTDQSTIDDIVKNGKRELSLGYTVDLIGEKGEFEGVDYDFVQRNIRYNHLSIVHRARAGDKARINLDASDAIEISINQEAKVAKKKIKIDEDEFMVEPEVADSVEQLVEDMKNLEAEKTRVEKELSIIIDRLEKAMAERDKAKEEAETLLSEKSEMEEEKMDSSDIDRLVKNRVKLLKHAELILDSESIEQLDGMDDLQIKKQIIKAKSPKARLDGQTDTYIKARYDAIIEDMPKNTVIARPTSQVNSDQRTESDATASRQKMIADMKKTSRGTK